MQRPLPILTFAAVVSVATILPAGSASDPPVKPPASFFQDKVQPLLIGKCLVCHSGAKPKGELDLTTRASALKGGASGAVIVSGKPDDSLLLKRLVDKEMPPKNPLTPEQVSIFREWFASGAAYENEPLKLNRAGPDWWALLPIRRPDLPAFSAWARNPIDSFIEDGHRKNHLQSAPEPERRILIRRVTFDLIGLPPTPDEVAAFIQDSAPDAYERLVDRLLASPHYGERWGRHWLDVVRFGESHGYETNQLRFNAWPYRDYVIRAINSDLPYPQFILEQLAGDALPDVDWLTQSATGFLVGGVHDVVGNQTEEGKRQQRMDDLDDMITATGTAFLGLTTNCCRCHDHKFDPILQKDYYALQAVFDGVEHTEREIPAPDAERRKRELAKVQAELAQIERQIEDQEPLARTIGEGPLRRPVNARRNVERFAAVEARLIRFTVLATNNLEPCIDELEIFTDEPTPRSVALASSGAKATASSVYPNSTIHQLEHINDGKYGNGRSWISNEMGKGWVQIELPEVKRINRIIWQRDREEKFKDRLATQYRIEVATEPEKWQVVASSNDRVPFGMEPASAPNELQKRQKELRDRLPSLAPMMRIYAGTFTPPEPTYLLIRGDPMKRGEVIGPGAIASIQPPLRIDPTAPEKVRRLALARWLGDPANPLPARVLVNRLWHYHFGQGIVNTPSDFGFQGGRPSHPELLDWLASEFMANGWRMKPIHRLMVLSAAYRQSSQANNKAMSLDKNNRLLWRMNPRRLEAEAIRDAILAVSGQLDRRMGGAGYNIWQDNTNYVVVFKPKTELGPNEFRRMIYQFKPRTQQDPTFGAFDCPDAALVAPRRNASVTALQALNLLNSSFILSQSEAFADRLRTEAGHDEGKQVRLAFRLAFARDPSASELAGGLALVKEHGLAAFCRAMYNANEMVYVE
jgi:hypothetical protein